MSKLLTEKENKILMTILIMIIPSVYILNEIVGTFIGGFLIISTLIFSIFFNRFYLTMYVFLSFLVSINNSISDSINVNQAIFRCSVFLVTLLVSAFTGQIIKNLLNKIELKNQDTIKFAKSVIMSFIEVIDEKDNYLNNHSKNVCYYTRLIAESIFDDKLLVEQLCLSALLHDIGKLSVPDNILNKKSNLNENEWSQIKNHCLKGVSIIDNIHHLKFCSKYIKYHHRHFNGEGYPSNLKIDTMPEEVGIISIADAFDAMTTDRPYRKAMTIEDACHEIYKNKGGQFHPTYVEAFLGLKLDIVSANDTPLNIDFNIIFGQDSSES